MLKEKLATFLSYIRYAFKEKLIYAFKEKLILNTKIKQKALYPNFQINL